MTSLASFSCAAKTDGYHYVFLSWIPTQTRCLYKESALQRNLSVSTSLLVLKTMISRYALSIVAPDSSPTMSSRWEVSTYLNRFKSKATGMGWPRRAVRRFLAARVAMSSLVSDVALPMCGKITHLKVECLAGRFAQKILLLGFFY